MNIPSLVRPALLAAALSLASALFGSPTPFPAEADEAAWPGVGPIRVFPWMTENRSYYWTVRDANQGAVVFVGDSLMGGWKALQDAFPGIKVANRGIGGDVSRGVLFRFREDVLDLNPRAIVLCVGTNDLSAHANPDNIIANISAIYEAARQANPKTPLLLCTIPPRNAPKAPLVEGSLDSLNVQIRAFAAGKPNVTIVDLFAALATPEGTPHTDYISKDGIHIAPAGFEKAAVLIRPVLKANGIVAAPATGAAK